MISCRRALTLIELLIVVAIVAILAAIAVPNFLDASTRAKVSKTRADLRTISVALESFHVDRNKYPPDAQFGEMLYIERLKHLTTPIAYMATVPADPFAKKSSILEYAALRGGNPYAHGHSGDSFIFPLTYDYAQRRQPDGTFESDSIWERISLRPGAVKWGLRGVGPDGWPSWLGDPTPPYDPTNGTVSDGNIFWTGPGIGEDRPAIL